MNRLFDGRLGTIFLVASAFAIGAVCSAALIFNLGIPDNATDSLNKRPQADVQDAGSGIIKDVVSEDLDNAPMHGTGSAGTSGRELHDLAKLRSGFERNLELYSLLANADETLAIDLLEQSAAMSHLSGMRVHQAILQRLAQLNPKKAYAQTLRFDEPFRGELVGIVFNEWSLSDLNEAVSFAHSLDTDERFAALKGILPGRADLSDETKRRIANQLGYEQYAIHLIVQETLETSILNPEKVWYELADNIQINNVGPSVLSRVASAWVDHSGLEILNDVSKTLTDQRVREEVLGNVLQNAAKANPSGALEYAILFESDRQTLVMATAVARIWARTDPISALNAASTIEKRGIRIQLEDVVIRTWVTRDPHTVLENLELIPDKQRIFANTLAISTIAYTSPIEAAKLVATLDEGMPRLEVAMQVAAGWIREDPSAAIEWILSDPGLESKKSHLLFEAMQFLVPADPQLAMDTALQQPISEESSGLEATVISLLVHFDFKKALELLPQVREGHTKLESYKSVGEGYLYRGEGGQALRLAQELPEPDRKRYLLSIISTWARNEPDELFASIDRLSSIEIKSAAALRLLLHSKWEESLSDQQSDVVRKHLTQEDSNKLEQNKLDDILGW